MNSFSSSAQRGRPLQFHATGLFLFLFLLLFPGRLFAETDHKVYFADTDYELHVFEIKGEYPGNTMLIIGGMHNEPGGYLSADLYADFSLHQGNLIVVPRANFPVIISNNRKIHSDMNRKFTNGNHKKSANEYEESVVEILKQLMARSDVLLNLHDGSGFYRPTYEDKLRNPLRWGQSIITDTETFTTPAGQTLALGKRVQRVLAAINPGIRKVKHHFHYNNTRTFDNDSPHKEQRGSATYYALNEYGIESYGVETSKEIRSLDLKVRYQSMTINAFMKEFGILPNNPKVRIQKPQLQYLLVSVNGAFPYGVPNRKTLFVKPGDTVRIEHIAANYERGLVADILGLGSLNDMNKKFSVSQPTTILVKKDKFECGKIYLAMELPPVEPSLPMVAAMEPQESGTNLKKKVLEFLILVNNDLKKIPSGETLVIGPEDTLVIQDITPPPADPKKVKVNFVGFVGNKRFNDAEDRGYPIHPQDLWKRHSKNRKGNLYSIEANREETLLGEVNIRIDRLQKTP